MTKSDFSAIFAQRLAEDAAAVERMLDALLGPAALEGEAARPERLLAAMRYAALDGGKRLRPFLLIETARLFGVEGEGVLRAACALEMVHCYSLVHDDLPAMDDDDLRRGRPTVHRAFDEATAVLAGDALLTYAFDVMADPATHADPQARCALTLALARAAGLGGMAGGQMLDLDAESSGAALTRAQIERLQAMKTGALLRFGAQAGAIYAGAGAGDLEALSAYGRALGAAFQIADDILDAEGDEARMGKRVAKDADRNKGTLVAHLGLEAARALRDELAREAVAALAPFGERAGVLAQAARFTALRAH
ncbi:MAG: geranylgeranyl pyrophosphate synthase [Hyphomicrobiales bacterium]|nr:geranylgeranyl pyrophosphate synthase [Hyphomicrobiales bacterium]